MPEIMPWHKTELIEPIYTRVDLVKEGANSQAHIKLFKSKGGESMTFEEIIAKMVPEHAKVITDALEAVKSEVSVAKAAQKTAETALEQIEKNKAPEVGASPEEILKSVQDPAVRALLETQIAKAAAAENVAKALQEQNETAAAIAKAKEIPNLGEEDKLADIYKRAAKVDTQLAEDVFGIFKAASAMVAEGGILSEVGKAAGSEGNLGGETDAWGKIELKATEVAKSSGITQAAAITEVIKSHPEMYDAYLKAQTGN